MYSVSTKGGNYDSSYTASAVPEADDQHVVFTPYNPAENLIRQEERVFGQNVVVFGGGNVFDWVDPASI